MSEQMSAYIAARERVLCRALDVLRAERRLIDPDGSVLASGKADDALCLAARDLTDAVLELPLGERPKGWGS